MDYLLKKYCPRIDFESYEDFYQNYALEIPPDFNFAYDVVDEWARTEPEKRALFWCNDKGEECVQTFTDISRLSDSLASAFQCELGLRKGDVVLLVLRQRWEYWSVACALMKLGVIFVPGSVQMTAKDYAYRAESAGFSTVIAVDEPYVMEQIDSAIELGADIKHKILVQQCSELVGTTPEHPLLPPPVIAVDTDIAPTFALPKTECGAKVKVKPSGDEDIAPTGWTSLGSLLDRAQTAFTRPTGDAATTSDDTLMLYFTSGTTGNPKMVRHTHKHPLGHIATAKYWQQVQENTLHLSVTDSGWAKFGWGKIYGQWICGATIFAYDWDKFVPTMLLQKVQDYRITTFCAPPTMYRFMLQEDVASYDLSSVANFTTAGEPLNAEVSTRWETLTGKQIREGFGQTEGSVLIATWKWLEPRPGSLGKPEPLYHIKLYAHAGTPDEQEADIGQEGAICITELKSAYPPGLFVGYYKNEEQTQEAVGGDYYNLGDMAWRDIDGYITFIGRNDDVIKASGYRIGPFEVESALVTHPAVIESAVTAAPDPLRGVVVKADVVLAAGYKPSDELVHELQDHVKRTTAPYKYPRIVVFVDELPKTLGGKIKRAEIRQKNEAGS